MPLQDIPRGFAGDTISRRLSFPAIVGPIYGPVNSKFLLRVIPRMFLVEPLPITLSAYQ